MKVKIRRASLDIDNIIVRNFITFDCKSIQIKSCNTTMSEHKDSIISQRVKQLQQIPMQVLCLLLGAQPNTINQNTNIPAYIQAVCCQLNLKVGESGLDKLQHCHPNVIVLWMFTNLAQHRQQTLLDIKKWFDQSQQHPNFCATLLSVLHNYEQQTNNFSLLEYRTYLGNHWHRFKLIGSERDLLHQSRPHLTSFLSYWKASIEEIWIKDYTVSPTQHQFSVFKLVLSLTCTLQPAHVLTLAHKYIGEYLKQSEKRTNKVPRLHIFLHMKLIELFHVSLPSLTLSPLGANKVFMANLYQCLCDFDTKGANVLGINIYGSIVRQLGLFNHQMQAFVDLYLTLDCYGMHLVKDIWDRFYVLCRYAKNKGEEGKGTVVIEGREYYLYSIVKMLHLVLSKVEQHSNHNVPKYCIQQLLAANPEDTCILFEQLEDTVYSSLVQILNTGTHYTDCTHFHQDSKIYKLTCMFYLGYYRQLVHQQNVQALQYHLNKLLTAMINYITFEHCIIAFIGIFSQLGVVMQAGKQVKVLGAHQISMLVALVNKFMIKLAFRKRWKFMQAVMKCLQDHANVNQTGLKLLIQQVLMKLPDIFLEVRSNGLPILYSLIDQNLSKQIPTMKQQLSEQLRKMQQDLMAHEDLSLEQYQPKLTMFMELQRELVILQNIECACLQSKQVEPIEVLLQSVQLVSKSLYSHPLQFISVLHAIAMHCKYGSLHRIASMVKASQTSAESLLNAIGTIGATETYKLLDEQHILICLEVVAMGIQVSNSHPTCRSNAKFIEYCISQYKQGRNSEYYLLLLINSLKFKLQYCHTYKAIEDSLYNLYQNLPTELSGVSPKYLLRVQILLFCILSNDFDYSWSTITNSKSSYVSDTREYCNLYDYEFYDEFFTFCGVIAKLLEKAHKKGKLEQNKWDEYKQTIFGHLQEAVKSMIHNLEYGVHKKEVVNSTEKVVNIAIIAGLNKQSTKLIDFMLEVGEKYWGFQRNTVFHLLKQFHKTTRIDELKSGFKELIGKFINIEEYRGQDSAIILTQHSDLPVYTKKQLHPEADYDGTAVRFATIEWSQNELNLLIQNGDQAKIKLWLQIFEGCFNVCMADSSPERMFMTGTHKTKIKYCQFMMIFPQFLRQYCSQQIYSRIVLRCVDSMSQNNLTQIRHYIETFMLKLIYLNPAQQLLQKICSKFSEHLLQIEGQSSLFKNVAYIMMSGYVLQLFYHHELFSSLFCCVCSHISYYRGLSQYFCYRLIEEVKKSKMKDSKYILILYQQFLKDEDAIKLTNKLDKMVHNYKDIVTNWNIYDHLFKLKPTLNGQVVSQEHYIDKLKHFGQELIKDHKHEDGFMPYRQAWKRIIKEPHQVAHQSQQQNLNSFQRKIDPSLDDLYNFEPLKQQKLANQLKVLVVSAEQIALYGHLARVGEILGISELCIPNKDIIEMEQFSNVSVTAEKWLNITQHKFQRVKRVKGKGKEVADKKKHAKQTKKQEKAPTEEVVIQKGKEEMLEIIKKHREEGYKIYLIKKGQNVGHPSDISHKKKTLVVIDELGLAEELLDLVDNCVSFNHYYSYHVQATILMWEYFKNFCLDSTVQ